MFWIAVVGGVSKLVEGHWTLHILTSNGPSLVNHVASGCLMFCLHIGVSLPVLCLLSHLLEMHISGPISYIFHIFSILQMLSIIFLKKIFVVVDVQYCVSFGCTAK